MTTLDDLVRQSPVFQLPCVVAVKVPEAATDHETRMAQLALREVSERTQGRVEFVVFRGDVEMSLAGQQASEHELVDALRAVKRLPSVQDQLKRLRERFLIVKREAEGGAFSTKL